MQAKIYPPSGSSSLPRLIEVPDSVLVKSQKKQEVKLNFQDKSIDEGKLDLVVDIRYDDRCGNGHNSFAITGTVYKAGIRSDSACLVGGCIHEIIEKHFPSLKKYLKWHGCSADGPTHFLANTLWHVSDRDHEGRKAGDPIEVDVRLTITEQGENEYYDIPVNLDFNQFSRSTHAFPGFFAVAKQSGLPMKVVEFTSDRGKPSHMLTCGELEWFGGREGNRYSPAPENLLRQFADLWNCADTRNRMKCHSEVKAVSEGKKVDIEAARRCAVWPDATLEQLRDEEALIASLPSIMDAFKADMEELGFVY